MQKRNIQAIVVALTIFNLSFTKAQTPYSSFLADPAGAAREHNVDMEDMLLDLHFKPERGFVEGKVTYTFTPIRSKIDSLYLDGPEINFKQVTLDGNDVKYKKSDAGITIYFSTPITWDTKHKITLDYEAHPKKGLYFIGWNDSTNRSRKEIWTQGELTDNRYWLPGYDDPDDKLITEVLVTFDSKYKVLSNGAKIAEKDNKDGTKTWHYKMPHPHALYLVMLGIGNYDIYTTKAASGVTINEWYNADVPEKREPTYRYTDDIMNFLEKEIGVPYAWGSYSQIPVQDFLYGAMENTSATIFGDFFQVNKREFLDRNYIGVNAHEMTHQWFGDLVTCRSGRNMWLHESFATYYAKLYARHHFGEDNYRWNCRGEANAALAASKTDQNPLEYSGAGGRIYPKGSCVLGMLRYVVGDEEYHKAVAAYLEKHKFDNVEAYDFRIAFHDVLGINLDWFFDEWIERGGEPHYDVSYEQGIKSTILHIKQTQTISDVLTYFKMPIVAEVHYTDGSVDSKKEWVEGASSTITVPNPGGKNISYVLFDPNSEILKSCVFHKSFNEWQMQALYAPNMIDRYDALVALRDTAIDKKTDLLIKVYANETFQANKAEILSQLAKDDNSQTNYLFKQAIMDKDYDARNAAISNIYKIPASDIADYEKLLTDSSYHIEEVALGKLCEQYPDKKTEFLDRAKDIQGINETGKIVWLRLSIEADRNKTDNLNTLIDYTTPAFEFRTRINALQALQALNYLDNKTLRSLFDASLSWNSHLAGPANDVLTYYYKEDNYHKMIKDFYDNGNWTKEQKETLGKVVK